jgi:hypothetical protein
MPPEARWGLAACGAFTINFGFDRNLRPNTQAASDDTSSVAALEGGVELGTDGEAL